MERFRTYVDMERVSRHGCVAHTGWPYVPTEKVSALLRKTGWVNYKLAIGVSVGMFKTPLQLRWVQQLKAGEYDPSVGELFDGISLDEGQNYLLVVSNLHEGLRSGSAYTMHNDTLLHNRYFDETLWRYRQLYMPPSPLWSLQPAARPTGPSRQASDKRPAETPPDDEPGAKFVDNHSHQPAGGSSGMWVDTDAHQSLTANLAALRRLITTRMPSRAGDAGLGGSQSQLDCMSQVLRTLA